MKIITVALLILLNFLLSGCGSQFTCGYDPDKFKLKYMFSIKNENVDISNLKLDKKIEQFGIDNGYCIANKSRETVDNNYLTNIQLVKKGFSFYIYGTKKHIFNYESKNEELDQEEIKLFCDFISPYLNSDKIKVYENIESFCIAQSKSIK